MASSMWTSFPKMDRLDLMWLRKTLDGAYKEFSRNYGDVIESLFHPLLSFLIWFEKLLIATPWWLMLIVCTGLIYAASRSWKLALAGLGALIPVS